MADSTWKMQYLSSGVTYVVVNLCIEMRSCKKKKTHLHDIEGLDGVLELFGVRYSWNFFAAALVQEVISRGLGKMQFLCDL